MKLGWSEIWCIALNNTLKIEIISNWGIRKLFPFMQGIHFPGIYKTYLKNAVF